MNENTVGQGSTTEFIFTQKRSIGSFIQNMARQGFPVFSEEVKSVAGNVKKPLVLTSRPSFDKTTSWGPSSHLIETFSLARLIGLMT